MASACALWNYTPVTILTHAHYSYTLLSFSFKPPRRTSVIDDEQKHWALREPRVPVFLPSMPQFCLGKMDRLRERERLAHIQIHNSKPVCSLEHSELYMIFICLFLHPSMNILPSFSLHLCINIFPSIYMSISLDILPSVSPSTLS